MKLKKSATFAVTLFLLAGCSAPPIADQGFNAKASMPEKFNFTKHGFKVICLLIDNKTGTMSTLYGNDAAIQTIKTANPRQTTGWEMALVKWQQQPNPYWYGNNIPGALLSVEMLTAGRKINDLKYSFFEGDKMIYKANTSQASERINFILAQKPSILP